MSGRLVEGAGVAAPGQRSEAVISMVLVVVAGAGIVFAWPEVSCIQLRRQRFAAPGQGSHTVGRGGRWLLHLVAGAKGCHT